ncbi:MAG: hypothetical protein AAF549_00945 [Pseudomonadota bacterium]
MRAAFKISSRDSIAEFCKLLSDAISEVIINNEPENWAPIIIAINGDDNIGKSAFWDDIRQYLLKKSGIFIEKRSSSYQHKVTQRDIRTYETWTGQLRADPSKSISYFVCNIGDLFYEYMGTFSMESFVKQVSDVIVLSKTDDDFVPKERHSAEITLENSVEGQKYATLILPEGSPLRQSRTLTKSVEFSP